MILTVAFGMQALVAFMGWAFDWIKLAGAAYLIFLGFKMLRSKGDLGTARGGKGQVLRLAGAGRVLRHLGQSQGADLLRRLPAAVRQHLRPTFPQIMLLGLFFMLSPARPMPSMLWSPGGRGGCSAPPGCGSSAGSRASS